MALLRAFRAGTPGLGRRFAARPRMIKASLKREYDGGHRLLLMVAAAMYIVSPIDMVPELFLVVFGLIDDAFVLTWLAGTFLAETERFLEWEQQHGRGPSVIRVEVVNS
jgi:uncharacterized membrane protein YkvA (DUF1232 family)